MLSCHGMQCTERKEFKEIILFIVWILQHSNTNTIGAIYFTDFNVHFELLLIVSVKLMSMYQQLRFRPSTNFHLQSRWFKFFN